MIICQYDCNKVDYDTINQFMELVNKQVNKEDTVIALPSGFTLAEFSDKEGLFVLKQFYEMIGKIIKEIESE